MCSMSYLHCETPIEHLDEGRELRDDLEDEVNGSVEIKVTIRHVTISMTVRHIVISSTDRHVMFSMRI